MWRLVYVLYLASPLTAAFKSGLVIVAAVPIVFVVILEMMIYINR